MRAACSTARERSTRRPMAPSARSSTAGSSTTPAPSSGRPAPPHFPSPRRSTTTAQSTSSSAPLALEGAGARTRTRGEFRGATVNHPGTYNVTGLTEVDAGQAHFTGTMTNAGNGLSLSGGTADFSSGETIAPTTLGMTGGILTGSDTVNVSGLTTWSSGTMDGAGVTNCNGGLNFDTAGQKGVSRTVSSSGNATWTAGDIRLFSADGIFNNSGTFDAQADGTTSVMFDSGDFHNMGTFKRTTSPTTLAVSCTFTNTGTVRVDAGTLNLSGGYTQTAGTTL